MTVGVDAGSRPFEVDISSKTASLDAIVLDDRRRPIAGVLVIAVPEPARRDMFEAYRSAVTDNDGRVRFTGVPPSSYTLFATETVTLEEWQNPAVFKQHESRGKAVTLGEGASQLVELRKTS